MSSRRVTDDAPAPRGLPSGLVDTLEQDWENGLFESAAQRAYEASRGLPRGEWPDLALVGLFLARWGGYYRRPYVGLRGLRYAIALMVTQHGYEDAVAAIESLFGEALAWVTRKSPDFLTDPERWAKWVEPALAAQTRRTGGEQAEAAQGSRVPGARRITD